MISLKVRSVSMHCHCAGAVAGNNTLLHDEKY